jgi:hypothetical protein
MTGKPIGRAQIERAERIAKQLEERRQAKPKWPRSQVDELRASEDYQRRLEQVEALREAARWVRTPSLGDGRVTLRTRAGEVVPEFEEWQLQVALRSLERQ